jgi:hypothetical protein
MREMEGSGLRQSFLKIQEWKQERPSGKGVPRRADKVDLQ